MYVCMSQAAERVCMYVCMSRATEHVCMYVSNIHTYKVERRLLFLKGALWACMYVSKPSACPGKWKLHAQTYTLKGPWKALKKDLATAPKRVCMFQSLSLSWKWNLNTRTYTLPFNQKSYLRSLLRVYVCLKSLCLSWFLNHTYTLSTSPFLYKHL